MLTSDSGEPFLPARAADCASSPPARANLRDHGTLARRRRARVPAAGTGSRRARAKSPNSSFAAPAIVRSLKRSASPSRPRRSTWGESSTKWAWTAGRNSWQNSAEAAPDLLLDICYLRFLLGYRLLDWLIELDWPTAIDLPGRCRGSANHVLAFRRRYGSCRASAKSPSSSIAADLVRPSRTSAFTLHFCLLPSAFFLGDECAKVYQGGNNILD